MDLWTLTKLGTSILRKTAFIEFPQSSICGPSKRVLLHYGQQSSLKGGVLLDITVWEAFREVLIMDQWKNTSLYKGEFFEKSFYAELEKKFKEEKLIF